MNKENRALVVMFHGNEVPENIIGRISKEIATWCEANIEKLSIYTLNEKELTKLIVKQTLKVDDSDTKCQHCNKAIKVLNEEINLKTISPQLFAIKITTFVMSSLYKLNVNALTDKDKEVLKAFKILGKGGPRSTSVAEAFGYTKEFDEIIRSLYDRLFDKNGKIKE